MTMSCEFHPDDTAIATCATCGISLCGVCTNYVGRKVFCESCVVLYETNISAAAQVKAEPKPTLPVDSDKSESAARKKQASKNATSPNVIAQLIVVVGILFVTVQLGRALNSSSKLNDIRVLIEEFAVIPLPECLEIFREIGLQLQTDDSPDPSLICDQSAIPNILTNTGNDIIVEYSRPDFYGYSRIYVSRNNPEPAVVAVQ